MTIAPIDHRRRFRAVPLLRLPSFAAVAASALRRLATAMTALVLPLAIFVAWSLAARYQLVAPQILPAPSLVGSTAVELIKSGQLQSELAVSLYRLAAGLLIGATFGLAVGLAMGLSSTLEDYLAPTVRAIWLVPSLGWLPFFMLIFGIGEAFKIVLIAKACFLPMMVNGFDGVRSISPKHREVARTLELGRFVTLRFVVIPSLLPYLLTGLRLSLSKGWQVLVLVEMIASAAGIGYLMTWGRKSFQLDIVLVAMLVIGVVGWLLDRAAFAAQARATAWASRSTPLMETRDTVLRSGRWRGIVLPAVLLALWAGVGSLTAGKSGVFVPLGAVIGALFESIRNGDLPGAAGATVLRAFLGWSLGCVLGFAVGLVIGLSALSRRLVAPTLNAARQIALFAWIPLFSAWLGNGEAMKIALIALSAFFPVVLHVEAGCRDAPVPFREVGRLFAFDRRAEIFFIILPAAAPTIISGLELAFAIAWIGTIGAEYLIGTGYMNASPDGIGAFLAGARENARIDLVVVGILALGSIGFVLDRAVVEVSRRAAGWHKRSR